MDNVSELAEYLKSLGYTVVFCGEKSLCIPHPSLPLYLRVDLEDNFVYMSIKHGEDLRSILEDMHDSGENVEEEVESALSYLSAASLKARMWVEERGYVPVFKLREGSLDIYEMLEEIVEESEEE